MITKEQRENNKAVKETIINKLWERTIMGFEWDRERFNQRMTELYPQSYSTRTTEELEQQLVDVIFNQ